MNRAYELSAEVAEQGIIGYPETDQQVYISKETLDKMISTIKGIPVVIEHSGTDVVGYVTDYYVTPSGYYAAKMFLHSQEAIDKLDAGWGFSTEIQIFESGEPGVHNAVPYDSEFLDGEFTRLAIVENPRHNKAKIFRNSDNSLSEPKRSFEMLFRKKKSVNNDIYVQNEKPISNEKDSQLLKFIKLGNKRVTLGDLVKTYTEVLENEMLEFKPDDTVKINGKEVTMQELIDVYLKMQEESEAEAVENNLEQNVSLEEVVTSNVNTDDSGLATKHITNNFRRSVNNGMVIGTKNTFKEPFSKTGQKSFSNILNIKGDDIYSF